LFLSSTRCAVPDARSIPETIEMIPGMSEAERKAKFGQEDHQRRFGRDFESRFFSKPGWYVEKIVVGEWYARRPESKIFLNMEYNPAEKWLFEELVFMGHKPN
jgi:hypothetical protein